MRKKKLVKILLMSIVRCVPFIRRNVWWWWWQRQQQREAFQDVHSFPELVSCSTRELDLSDKVAQQQQQLAIIEAHTSIYTLHHLNNTNNTIHEHTKKTPWVKKEVFPLLLKKTVLQNIGFVDARFILVFFFSYFARVRKRIFHADKIEKTFAQHT